MACKGYISFYTYLLLPKVCTGNINDTVWRIVLLPVCYNGVNRIIMDGSNVMKIGNCPGHDQHQKQSHHLRIMAKNF